MNLDSPAGRAVIEAAAEARFERLGYESWAECDPVSRENYLDGARIDITAALAVRVPCETCGGSGMDAVLTGGGDGTPSYRDVEACPDCDGSGTVSALRLLMEEA